MVEGKFYFAAALCPNPKSTVEYTILKRSQKNGGVLGPSQEDGKQLLSWMQKARGSIRTVRGREDPQMTAKHV